jgi:cell division protein FtsB
MERLVWDAPTLRRNATYILALLCLVLLLQAVFGPHGFLALCRERGEVRVYQQRNQLRQRENEQLEKENKALESDRERIIKRLHGQGYVFPGETIYKQVNPSAVRAPLPATGSQPPSK